MKTFADILASFTPPSSVSMKYGKYSVSDRLNRVKLMTILLLKAGTFLVTGVRPTGIMCEQKKHLNLLLFFPDSHH